MQPPSNCKAKCWLSHLPAAYLRCKSVDHHAASIKLRGQVLALAPVCQQACQGELPAFDPTPGGIAQPIERRQPSITCTCLHGQQQVGRQMSALVSTPGCIAQPIERRQPSITCTCLHGQQQVGR